MTKGKDEPRSEFEDDLDALFKLPLIEFTVARNALATKLKKSGNGDAAVRVKALAKPSVSAWAVNQLYWKHRDAFDLLIAAGQRLRQLHASQLAGKPADVRGPLAERRETVAELSRLAGALLRDGGHNPAQDTMRRISSTLEALSTVPLSSDGPTPGRLTDDVDPPGFESLAGLMPDARREPPSEFTNVVPFPTSARALRREDFSIPVEERRRRVAAAKAALQTAEETLRDTRTRAQDLASDLKKANAFANETEKERRDAEERFSKAGVAAEEARERLQKLAAEAEKTARVLEDAERSVDKARKELKDHTETAGSR